MLVNEQSTEVDRPLGNDAKWMWAPDTTGANCYVEFRRLLELASIPAEAWIQLSAETSLRLWINGRLVHSGPPREVPPYFYFDTISLLPFLRSGSNEMRIVAHHQGQNSASYQTGTPAILVAGRCADNREVIADFADIAAWQTRPITRYRRSAHRLFFCIGFAEVVDFSEPEAPWTTAQETACHPWRERPEALARDLPLLTETVRKPASSVSHSGGWLVDFGMEVSGYVALTFQTNRPLTIRIAYSEALVRGLVATEKAGMAYFDVLMLPKGKTMWLSYEKRAFRFLHLSESVEVLDAEVIEQCYPYQQHYRDSTTYLRNRDSEDGQLINRILDTSARTIALNSEDLLTDCPWRERAQYLDCHFYMGAMLRLFGTLEPIRRFLKQFPRGADATGLLRMCYPSPKDTTVIPDFSISYAVMLKRYLELSGDLDTVKRNLPLAERGVTAFRPHEDADGLLVNVPGWIFLDNTFELPKFPRSAALNAVYYGGHQAVAHLLRSCGQAERAAAFDDHATKIRAAFRQTFLSKNRLLDSDSTPTHESFYHWNYHFSSESGLWEGKCFRLRISYRLTNPSHPLRIAVHASARAWIDGALVADITEGGSWQRSAIYQPVELPTPANCLWHRLDLEVQWTGIDWECFLSCAAWVEWSPSVVWEESEFANHSTDVHVDAPPSQSAFESTLRRHHLPWMTQITVGYAAFHGLLEEEEARRFLRDCLPTEYRFAYSKRSTPFFATIDAPPEPKRILPCNVPASMYYFCHALRQYGMSREAKELLLPIYRGMIERGATTWWEEWNSRSSLCHAWASFAVEFLDDEI